MTVRSNYIGTKSELVVPFVAALYADASGQMGVIQREDVTVTGIDDVFDVNCTLAQAANLLNAFSVTDVDQNGMLGLSAEVRVDFEDINFSSALAEIIAYADAGNSADATPHDLHKYLLDETHSDLLAALSHDGLANMLEASDLNVEIALDASNGAANMATELEGSGSCPPHRVEQYRKAIFAQIPEYTIEQYLKVSDGSGSSALEDVSGIHFMPLLTGDVLTFVFDVTVCEYMNNNIAPGYGANIQRVFRDKNTNYVDGSGDAAWNASGADVTFNQDLSGGYVLQQATTYAPTGGLTFVSPTKRRVALKVHLGMASEGVTEGLVFDLVSSIYNGSLAPTATNPAGPVVVA